MPDCLCTRYARATEWAALAGARWLGRADEEAAEEAAANGMKAALDQMPIDGQIVIGARTGEALPPGGRRAPAATASISRSTRSRGAASSPAAGWGQSRCSPSLRGALLPLPDMYMRTIAVRPRARGVIDLDRPVADNVRAVAESFDRQPIDITALVLDRPRHHDLVEELRAAGTRIKLIGDGTVTARSPPRSAARTTTSRSGSAARVRRCCRRRRSAASAAGCRRSGRRAARRSSPREVGVEDVTRVFTQEDLARGDVIVVATGVTNGDLLRGVRFLADSARTHSLIMCMRCNWVRFDDGIHFFARERREEVRLLG